MTPRNYNCPRTAAEFQAARLAYYQHGRIEPLRPHRGCTAWLNLLSITILPTLALAVSSPPDLCGIVTPPAASASTLAVTKARTVAVAVTNTAARYSSRLGASGSIISIPLSDQPSRLALESMDATRRFLLDYTGSDEVTSLLYTAGTENGVDPLILAALAKYESRFNRKCIGAAGERGLLQIHPCHKRRMKRMGLDFYAEADRLVFACLLFNDRGWQPWSVRSRAKREYKRIKGVVNDK